MAHEQSQARDALTATLQAGAGLDERIQPADLFTLECSNADGTRRWRQQTDESLVNPGIKP